MDDAMEYSGWAIVDFKREAVQAGVTPRRPPEKLASR